MSRNVDEDVHDVQPMYTLIQLCDTKEHSPKTKEVWSSLNSSLAQPLLATDRN